VAYERVKTTYSNERNLLEDEGVNRRVEGKKSLGKPLRRWVGANIEIFRKTRPRWVGAKREIFRKTKA